MSDHQSFVRTVPPEILTQILDFMPFREKVNARFVCHYWLAVLDGSGKFKFRPVIEDNTLIDSLLNSCLDMDSVTMSHVTKELPSMTFSRNGFPKIRNAILGNQNSGSVVFNFLKYGCQFVETINIRQLALVNAKIRQIPKALGEVKWENLIELEMTVVMTADETKLSRAHVESLICLLEFAKIPQLKKLLIYWTFKSDFDSDRVSLMSLIQKLCSRIYKFILRHSDTLKKLYWMPTTEFSENGISIQSVSDDIVNQILSKLKLDIYSVRARGNDNIYSIVLPSLSGSNSLTSLTIDNNAYQSLKHERSEFIGETLQRNKMTLTNVEMYLKNFDFDWLKNFDKLKFLIIGVPSGGGLNMSIECNFPVLTSFGLCASKDNFTNNFDVIDWIVKRMKNLEKITLATFHPIFTVQMLQTLHQELHRLNEIKIEWDFSPQTNAHTVKDFCKRTSGLTFKYLDSYQNGMYTNYIVEKDH